MFQKFSLALLATTYAAPIAWDDGAAMMAATDQILANWQNVQKAKAANTQVSAENVAKIDPAIKEATDSDGKTYIQYVTDLAAACKTEDTANPGTFVFNLEDCKASTEPKARTWLALNAWRDELATAEQQTAFDAKVAELKAADANLAEDAAIDQAYAAVFNDASFTNLYSFGAVATTEAPEAATKAPNTNKDDKNGSEFLKYSMALLAAYAIL